MKKVSLLFSVFFGVLLLSGCGTKKDAFEGIWEGETNDGLVATWEFDGEGVCNLTTIILDKEPCAYVITEDKVEISTDAWDKSKIYEFKIEGDTMSLMATDQLSPDYKSLKKK